jgi:hypothetical protein
MMAVLATGVLLTVLTVGFGHRGAHAVRNLLVPGAGLYDARHVWLGITFTGTATAGTVAWFRWGVDWVLALVVATSMVVSARLAVTSAPPVVTRAAHEFPLVVLVVTAWSSVQVAWRRTRAGRWWHRRTRRDGRGPAIDPLDRCRAAVLEVLAGSAADVDALDVRRLRRRCRRIGAVARLRFGGDPLRVDHAHVRAALAAVGALDDAEVERFAIDADRAFAGIPASEPGWVRLLDATLAALVLDRHGHGSASVRWAAVLDGPLQLRRGHRPGALWTPAGLRGPHAAPWEQAAAAGLSRAAGWIDTDADWHAVRARALGAAARRSTIADDERLIGAARVWLALVVDDQAQRVVERTPPPRDPVAVALARIAAGLAHRPPGSTPFHLVTSPTGDVVPARRIA